MITRHKTIKAIMEHQKFLGCDRELTMSLILVCIALSISSMSFWVFLLALMLYILCQTLLYKMAKHDLILRKVYLRHLKYKSFYKAQGYSLDKVSYRK